MISVDCRKATEKAFMFITTTERDCFITSLRQVTATDYQFFEIHLDSSSLMDTAEVFRIAFVDIITDLSQGVLENGDINLKASKNMKITIQGRLKTDSMENVSNKKDNTLFTEEGLK